MSRPSTSGVPGGRPDQVEQQADGRGLAGAVGTQEAEDLAALDDQVDVDDAARAAVLLGEASSVSIAAAIRGPPSCRVRVRASQRSISRGISRSRKAYMSRTSCSGSGLPSGPEQLQAVGRELLQPLSSSMRHSSIRPRRPDLITNRSRRSPARTVRSTKR